MDAEISISAYYVSDLIRLLLNSKLPHVTNLDILILKEWWRRTVADTLESEGMSEQTDWRGGQSSHYKCLAPRKIRSVWELQTKRCRNISQPRDTTPSIASKREREREPYKRTAFGDCPGRDPNAVLLIRETWKLFHSASPPPLPSPTFPFPLLVDETRSVRFSFTSCLCHSAPSGSVHCRDHFWPFFCLLSLSVLSCPISL